jgi:hypothetical protein
VKVRIFAQIADDYSRTVGQYQLVRELVDALTDADIPIESLSTGWEDDDDEQGVGIELDVNGQLWAVMNGHPEESDIPPDAIGRVIERVDPSYATVGRIHFIDVSYLDILRIVEQPEPTVAG